MSLSPQNAEKIKSYFGFATKAGKVVLGTDNILKARGLKLILVSADLSENAQKKITAKGTAEIITLAEFSVLGAPPACKAAAVKEKSLADRIAEILRGNPSEES